MSVYMIKRITKDGLLLCLLIISGILSIPFGDNVKISLQTFMLFLIFLLTDKLIDKITITISYMLLGLFIPIYSGLSSGISPTFGFIIGFILSSISFHLLMKINISNNIIKILLATLLSLLIIYISGTIFMMIYLSTSFINALLIGVVPYILIDLAKIGLIILITETNKKTFNILSNN